MNSFFFLIIFCNFIIRHCLKQCFMVTFIFVSISLSSSRYLNHGFWDLFRDKKVFFKKNCFVLCVNFYYNISYMFFFPFILFTLFHVFLFPLSFIDINEQFSGHKYVNVSFCEIKYLDLRLSLNFFSFSYSYY